MSGTVAVPKDKYIALIVAEEELRRLENGGVDNWEWFDEAMNPEGEPSMYDFEIKVTEEVNKKWV